MNLFKHLTPEEEGRYRKWARDNYTKFSPISGVWHPVVQDECAKMNAETGYSRHFTLEQGLEAAGFEEIKVDGLSGDGITVMRGRR